VQGSFFLKDLKVVGKLRKDRSLNSSKDCTEKLWLKYSSRRCKFAQVNKSSWRKYLIHFAEFIRKERTVGIPRGEFANHRKPLDLGKVQGRYDECIPKRFQAQEGWSH
jgi:hypothetical protein